MAEDRTSGSGAARGGCARPLLYVGLTVLVLAGGVAAWRWRSAVEARRRQEARAEQQFAPVFDKLDPAARAEPGPGYDLDETIKVIHDIDLALQESDSLGEYLQQMARRDYDGVAPEILAARKELMEVLFEIYSKQAEIEDQQQMWGLTSELLLSTLSVVGGDADVGPLGPKGSLQIDREQARVLLEDLKDRQEARLQLGRDERRLESRLIDSLVAYADVYHRYVVAWDRLCTLRDRSYLAVANGDWVTAAAAADEAIAMAPREREAHLLKALAMIEGGQAADPESARAVEALLADYIDAHPDRSAPAFLLRGVLNARLGRVDAARLDLQQAAVYYPRQAEALSDMLDPYRMRSYLRKTREGRYVIELYKSTMLGAGYMSPDLQQARILFESGDFEGGRAKVLDHFSRRRAQEQWDFLLSDIEFAQILLGEDFRRIFPEDQYLDLVVEPGMIGSRLSVGVRNRSDRTLHNATLVLALHLTDMHPDDYEPVVAGDTRPAVLAHETTDFGSVDIDLELWGKHKGVDDIVTHRAILVANEAVVWVDTDEYKIAEGRAFRDPEASTALVRAEAEARAAVAAGPRGSTRGLVERLLADARSGTTLQVDERALLKDGVTITLPKELAVLRPLFRLRYGGAVFTADDNLIVGDHIELRFDRVEDFGGQDHGGDRIELVASTVLGDLVWTWGPEGGNRFRLVDVVGQE